jgi:hypothetical protein
VKRLLLLALGAAVVVFCIVQDRVTAAAARRYVQLHREAGGPASAPRLDEVMVPAVRRSVRDGLLSGIAGGAVVLGAGALAARRRHRE